MNRSIMYKELAEYLERHKRQLVANNIRPPVYLEEALTNSWGQFIESLVSNISLFVLRVDAYKVAICIQDVWVELEMEQSDPIRLISIKVKDKQ